MSKKWLACWAMALTVLVSCGQSLFADGLDKEEREEVSKIVAHEIHKAAPEIAKMVIGALKEAHHTPAPKPGPKPGLNDALEDLLKEQERCDDREKLAKVIRRLVGTADGSAACTSGCYGLSFDCNYRRPDGSIDFGKFIECEVRQQELIEERQKLGNALKRLISGNECCDGKKEQACIETSPYYSPVVYRSSAGTYLRSICVE